MKPTVVALAAIAALALGCQAPTGTEPTTSFTLPDPAAAPTANVVHKVSAGGDDICEAFGLKPGCDGNFSLTAIQKADGTVSGQWQDVFAGGGNGVHVDVDCLHVVGNWAVIGGVVTHGSVGGTDFTGARALTAVVDNGTSQQDPPDQISFSFFPTGASCMALSPARFPLNDLRKGQVTVR